MSLDRIFRHARISRQQEVLDIGISAGCFAAIGNGQLLDAPSADLAGRAVAPRAQDESLLQLAGAVTRIDA